MIRTAKHLITFKSSESILLLLCLLFSVAVLAGNTHITNVNTDNAMYNPGTSVTIYVDLVNNTTSSFNGSVEVEVSHLGDILEYLSPQTISYLGPGQNTTKIFSWTPPTVDFHGYLIQVTLKNGSDEMIDSGSSAIDVSSDWKQFPRYGYISRFDSGLNTGNIIWQLKNYHINGLQYYDAGWKHHIPAPPSGWSTWPDVANRTNSRTTVTGFTSAAAGYNMKSLIYDDWGAAYDDCYIDGSGVTLSMGRFWGTPASTGNQYSWSMPDGWATSELRLMNNRDTGWQNYIYGRIQDAYDDLGFDGWHMDSLITNWSAFDYWGSEFNVFQYNPEFINNARTYWNSNTPLVQNLINGNGLEWMKSADVDFIYAELWENYPNYNDLKRFFNESRSYSSKSVVYAAYINYDKESGYFNEPGVRLANAAIFACGASHIELGDGDQMLSNEYFPNQDLQMTDSLRSAMRTYYDFLTGYENLLRDDTVSADGFVSATISGVSTSTNASPGTIWIIPKMRPGYNIIHLVNLLNNTSAEWGDKNGTYPTPPTQTGLPVKMYYKGAIKNGRLFYATPDSDDGRAIELNYSIGSDGDGDYMTFMVPQLQYWDMIWLEINKSIDADTKIEAENFDTYSAIATETCYDSGGGKDVGFVNHVEGDSYLGFGGINFSSAGALNVSARVASEMSSGVIEFHLDRPDGTLISTVSVGNTGGWQNWQTKTASVSGVSGVHDLYIVFMNAASNLNWFTFTLNPHFEGDLTLDGKVNLEDIAELGSGWQTGYDVNTLLDITYDWLSDAGL